MKDRPFRHRPPLGFLSCPLIVGVAAAIIIRFAWAPILMAFVLVGVTSVGTMVAVIGGERKNYQSTGEMVKLEHCWFLSAAGVNGLTTSLLRPIQPTRLPQRVI